MFYLFALLLVAVSASSAHPRQELGGSTCAFCEFVVQTCEGFILNNSTEQHILSWLGTACALLPSPYNALCSQELDQYGSQVIQWIANKENPEVVCQQLHLCTSSTGAKVPVQVKKPLQSSCSVCELAVTFVENYLQNNGTVAGVEAALDAVCAVLPSPYGTQCTAFVQQQLPALIQWLLNNENPQTFCTQVGLCTSVTARLPVHHTTTHKALQSGCSVCELVVTYIESYLNNNNSIAEIEAIVEGFSCNLLPSPWNAECNIFIDTYAPQLIQWIIQNETPQGFCTQVGLCTSARLPVHKVPVRTHKALQSECSICQLVVTYVEGYLTSNATEAEIVQKLEAVCNFLPVGASTCNGFVEQYVPQLITWIENNENPQAFCTQVSLCTSARLPVHRPTVHKALQSSCSICELVATYVESYVANNATEAQIVQKLETVCSLLPASASVLCKAFVDQYVPQLITWIENNENPQAFCTQVHLCTSARLPVHTTTVHKALQSECSICELVVTYVESYVANTATEAQIVQKLETVCALLPAGTSALCNTVVEQYVPQLITWIENKENPKAFCTQVGLCTASKAPRRPTLKLKSF